jgi:hypothetical protein
MASPSNTAVLNAPYQVTRAQCAQCGSELRYVPFSLANIMCRDCYGSERYKKGGPPSGKTDSYKPMEVTQTDEQASQPSIAPDAD